jgi:FecR protein
MTAEHLDEELVGCIGALCDGTLSADDCARLDTLVMTDAAARQCYNNYMFLHAELYAEHASVEGAGDCGFRTSDCGLSEAIPQSAIRNPKSISWLAVAAALVGVAAVSSWLTYAASRGVSPASSIAASQNEGESEAPIGGDQGATVARITATRNCLWQSATQGVGFGSRLEPGRRLELAAGLVEVTFDDGAAVVLEGPATFDVQTRGQARLHEGRLSAVVPLRATGFRVATSQVNVVDVGTEFGLMAEPDGATEIHVFNGLVKAHLLDTRGNEVQMVELTTSQGARIQPAAAMVARIPARDEEFVRSLSVAPGPHDGLHAYDGFNYPAGTLEEQNGGFGWAGPWFNVEVDARLDANSNGVALGNLEYEGLVPTGNRAVQTAHQNRVRRALGTSVGGVFDAAGLVENQDGMRLVGRDGTVVYLSFLQRVDKPGDVFYGLELHRSDGNANRVLCIGHGAEGTGYGVTSNFNVYGQRNFPPLGEENTAANFFVVRITFGGANRDRVEVLRNPESLINEDACIVDGELVGNFAFDRISLGNFHGTKVHEVDEIRVGTTFRAVTGRRTRGPDRLMPQVAATGDRRANDGGWRLFHGRELAVVNWLRK